jgi:poly(3-hydroxybutyrate) depolymerase
LTASQTLAFWAIANRCRGFDQAVAESREPGVTILRAIGRHCRGGETEAWFVQGAGHDWPGGNRLPRVPRWPANIGDRRDVRGPRVPASTGCRSRSGRLTRAAAGRSGTAVGAPKRPSWNPDPQKDYVLSSEADVDMRHGDRR